MSNIVFNTQQKASIQMIRNDLRYIYTIVKNKERFHSNYVVSAMPFTGIIIDGTEDWIRAYNRSNKDKLNAPTFTDEEQQYYEEMRSAIKMWSQSYGFTRSTLEKLYITSDQYFSSVCKPFARKFKLYDIFGADLVDDQYCGNTILYSSYVPNYRYDEDNGEQIKKLSVIAGKYVALFGALSEYQVDGEMKFSCADYGCFIKSPVGNAFSDKFVLFSMLCQVNFVLYCIAKFIIDESSTKLRFAYLQYFYCVKIIPEINFELETSFYIDDRWQSDKFRNAMAHYKVGVALKPEEVISDDPLFGLAQKYFQCDYFTLKQAIIDNLSLLAQQLKDYLHLNK